MRESKEIWKIIKDFEGLYEISNLGRVKRLERVNKRKVLLNEKILNQYADGDNFKVVSLYKNGKYTSKRIHRLVANAFIPNPAHKKQVKFLDNNKNNVNLSNLQWCHQKHNNNNICWCKGLTKETDNRISKYAEKLSGRKFSIEHKENISKSKTSRKLTDKEYNQISKAGKIGVKKIAKFRKGKTLKEIYGEKKAKEIKNKLPNRIPWNYKKTSLDDKRILSGNQHPLFGKERSPETKKKLSIKTLQQYKNGKISKSRDTSIEKKIKSELEKRNIIFEQQYNFNDKYSCDFALTKYNLIIECDGDYWHANPKFYKESDIIKTTKLSAKEIWERDRKRDKYIENHGWKVLRFWEIDINNNLSKCVDKIERFIKEKNI